MNTVVTYVGRSNKLSVQLLLNGSPPDLIAVTKLLVEVRYTTGLKVPLNNITHPTAVQFTATGQVDINLDKGTQPDGSAMPTGSYMARIITIDPTDADGVVWFETPGSLRD